MVVIAQKAHIVPSVLRGLVTKEELLLTMFPTDLVIEILTLNISLVLMPGINPMGLESNLHHHMVVYIHSLPFTCLLLTLCLNSCITLLP